MRINDKNYIIPISKHERYASRPDSLEHMCFAQFLLWYKPLANETKRAKFEDFSSHEIICPCPHQAKPTKMPIVIQLKDPSLGCMKFREFVAVLKFHKFREDVDPFGFIYSELLLYKH